MACDGFRIDRRAWLGWMSWRANSSQFLRLSFSCSLMRTFAYGGFGCAALRVHPIRCMIRAALVCGSTGNAEGHIVEAIFRRKVAVCAQANRAAS